MEGEEIIPLLDGLDEVAAPHREGCVEAINSFRRGHGLLPIAVCSRIIDYSALVTKLRLRNAIEVQPLSQSQVEEYLRSVGEPLRALRTTVNEDPFFWELLDTPLMLWVAVLAYRDAVNLSMPEASLEQRRLQLFAHFVEAMFRRRGSNLRYGPDKIRGWLSSLACNLTRNNQTVFYLENLDFQWLPGGLTIRRSKFPVITGVIAGLNGALIAALLGLIFTAIVVLSLFLYVWRINGQIVRPNLTMLFTAFFGFRGLLVKGAIYGLILGLVFGLVGRPHQRYRKD